MQMPSCCHRLSAALFSVTLLTLLGCTTINDQGRVRVIRLHNPFSHHSCEPEESVCGCPDDYCPKPIPCDPGGPTACCCEDYCEKPVPGYPCPSAGCGDDYCSKCWTCPPSNPIPGATCFKGTATGYVPEN